MKLSRAVVMGLVVSAAIVLLSSISFAAEDSEDFPPAVTSDTPAFSEYKLNDNAATSTVVDSGSGAINVNANVNTNLLTVTGKINQAFHFDGTSQYVNLDNVWNSIKDDSIGSFSFWMNPEAGGTVLSFAGSQGALDLNWASSINAMVLGIPGFSCHTTGANIPAGSYAHIVVVQDGVNLKVYVNGVEQNLFYWSQSNKGSWLSATQPSVANFGRLGVFNPNGQDASNIQYFKGDIDDLRYYKRALSASEVQALYNAGSGIEGVLPSASVENDSQALNGKRLTINTGTASLYKLSYAHNTAGDKWVDAVSNSIGYTLETPLKVVSSGTSSAGDLKVRNLRRIT